jgi:hypothetical protein
MSSSASVSRKGNGMLAVYVDIRANAAQRAALEAIFTGAAGGPPSLFGPMISTRLPTKIAQIEFKSDGKTWKLSIPGITDVTVEGVAGVGNQNVWLDNVGHRSRISLSNISSNSARPLGRTRNFREKGQCLVTSYLDTRHIPAGSHFRSSSSTLILSRLYVDQCIPFGLSGNGSVTV